MTRRFNTYEQLGGVASKDVQVMRIRHHHSCEGVRKSGDLEFWGNSDQPIYLGLVGFLVRRFELLN